MLVVRVCGSFVVCALLAVTKAAHAQPAPAPGIPPAQPEAPAHTPPSAASSPEAAPPAPASPPPAAPAPSLDPAVIQSAAKAKATGEIIEVTDPAVVATCFDLGQAAVDTTVQGPRGRFVIRHGLQTKARARGASHVRYFGRSVLADSGSQRERGQFYDCTRPGAARPAAVRPAAPAPSVAPAKPSTAAPPSTPATPSGSRPPASPATPTSPAALVTSASSGSIAPSSSQLTIVAGALFELAPVTSVEGAVNNISVTRDAATAYGISGNVEALISPFVALGLSPGLMFGLRSATAVASDTQFDLRARMRVGKLVDDGFLPYAYGTVGVSWIFGPNNEPTAVGAVLGAGIGLSHQVEHDVFVTFELGYQHGFQGATVNDTDVDAGSRLFHLGLGVNWNL